MNNRDGLFFFQKQKGSGKSRLILSCYWQSQVEYLGATSEDIPAGSIKNGVEQKQQYIHKCI